MKKIFSIFLVLMLAASLVVMPAYADNGVDAVNVEMKGGALNVTTGNTTNMEGAWTTVLTQYRSVIVGVSGVAALTFLLFFILNFTKLGQSAGNPQMRSQAIMGLIWTGIACAGCGGVALFVGFFYNLLNSTSTPTGT